MTFWWHNTWGPGQARPKIDFKTSFKIANKDDSQEAWLNWYQW